MEADEFGMKINDRPATLQHSIAQEKLESLFTLAVYDETKKMIFVLKQTELYIANDRNATKRILDENGPRPTVGEHLPAAKKALPLVRTPSGENRFVCDDSIRPKPKK